MSYLLIGNISALICNDCVEPLANARIRVYLPAVQTSADPQHGIFNDMKPLSAREVLMKADRLLAEATLDEKGNFNLAWNEIHLITEALELDLCLDQLPGKNGSRQPRNFHLSKLVLHWKRSSDGYVGAYAYVIPAATWHNIYANAGAWVITGVVKQHMAGAGHPDLKVEAYNALTGQLIGHAHTNEVGRYTIHFSREHLSGGSLQTVLAGRHYLGPDVYFKVYRNEQLLWAEDEKMARLPERQDLRPCSNLNIVYKPSRVKRASSQIGNWFSDVITLTGPKKKKSDKFRLLTHSLL
ncbi:hypothetical protein [Chitinophaga arvensicola]|uniref:Carboxypeptidase regulatory-like domain-containing protein n=1 Tax=Chitinophaga arvensicola TaxID=29529 RepID=A0A1I0S6B4_9BACT|nr:hypothetical protein [Chitinophaga arvensicola]SEW50840.1 hypothetical protein SAMN04488122_3980 [Chitinophaga arvensicola]